MIDLCGEMIVPQFGEHKYIHEVGSKHELMLYWIRGSTATFKKEINLSVKSNLLNLDDISRIDVIIGGDYGQGTFRFPMKLLFVLNSEHMLNVQVVLLTFYAKKIMVICSKMS